MDRTYRIGTMNVGRRRASIYVHATLKAGVLSISGVIGPLASGNCLGGCGQIDMEFYTPRSQYSWVWQHWIESMRSICYAPGWDAGKFASLLAIWNRWHLNDMRGECVHQRRRGESYATHPLAVCPDCGYELGSAWHFEEVPAGIIAELESFPPADKTPAWI